MIIKTRLDIGDKVYIVFGNPAHSVVIFSATIYKVEAHKKSGELKIYYNYEDLKVEVNKSKDKKMVLAGRGGMVQESYIDNDGQCFPLGLSNWPTFTTKKACKEFIKRKIEEAEMERVKSK